MIIYIHIRIKMHAETQFICVCCIKVPSLTTDDIGERERDRMRMIMRMRERERLERSMVWFKKRGKLCFPVFSLQVQDFLKPRRMGMSISEMEVDGLPSWDISLSPLRSWSSSLPWFFRWSIDFDDLQMVSIVF